jgi:hypothetical protein
MIFDGMNMTVLEVISSSLAILYSVGNNKMVDIYKSALHESQKIFRIQDTGTC